jgi:outer membrane receptor for ferrienterochelin and colicins
MKIIHSAIASMAVAMLATPSEAQTVKAAAAQAPSPTPQSDDAELEGLLKILQEETAVATKTRMNGDYVPGIVTVLHGEEMAALGARTVWDALSMVPGIEAVRDPTGLPSVIVRGIQFPFNSGNVKLLVDSMPAARDNAGVNGIVLDMPIQIVDRIEVIRGPGSVVYGDFAYMGLIHILTRKTGALAYGRVDESGGLSGGFAGGGRTKGGLEYSIAGSGFSGGEAEVPANRDIDDTRGFGYGALRYRGFSLAAGVATRETSDVSRIAPIDGQQTHSVVEGRYERSLSPSAQIEFRTNHRWNRYRNNQSDLDGDAMEVGASFRYTGARRQSWVFDAAYTRSKIDDALFKIPQGPIQQPAPPPGQPRPPQPVLPLDFSIRDERLAFTSFMAQDTIDASAKLAITIGARVDQYGDVDTRVTPRASMVYRATDKTIVKLQYAEGFRAPTFFELYSRGFRYTNLDFEVNQTAELNVVHRSPGTVARLTAYSSNFKNLLYVTGVDPQRRTLFENARKARVYGAEFELERELGKRLKALFNVSWFDTRDSRNMDGRFIERETIPSFMGNLALIAAPRPRVRLTARWHYVGDRASELMPAYHEFEGTATLKGVVARGVDLRSGVRFSRGAGVIYPQVLPTGTTALSYEFPKYFAELSWSR